MIIRLELIEELPGNENTAAATVGEVQVNELFRKFVGVETPTIPLLPLPPIPVAVAVPAFDAIAVCRMDCLDNSRLCSRIAFRSLASFGLYT